jgi:uncharacterized protein (DUF427 family)
MLERTIKVPDDDHPIAIECKQDRIVVVAAGKTIADTRRAIALHEAGRAAVYYIPREDVHAETLERSPSASYCPYKGEACHFHISAGGERLADAAWTYHNPYWAVAEIENHIAFDPDRVDDIEICLVDTSDPEALAWT